MELYITLFLPEKILQCFFFKLSHWEQILKSKRLLNRQNVKRDLSKKNYQTIVLPNINCN